MQAQIKHVAPYVLHTTYVYGEQHGKRSRIREAGLWIADQPDYFDGPKFLSLDIQLPPVCPALPPCQPSCPLVNTAAYIPSGGPNLIVYSKLFYQPLKDHRYATVQLDEHLVGVTVC